MRRLNLPIILDTAFAGICAFLLFFTAVRFYTRNAVIALIFGIAALLLFSALCFLYISNKQNASLLLSRNEKQKKLLALHLSLSTDNYIVKLFAKCFGEGAKIRGKRVICGEQTYFFNFKMQPVSEDEIARVIKVKCDGKKILYLVKISAEAQILAEHFSVETVKIDEIYEELKERDLLPEKYAYEEAKKIGLFRRIKLRFSRKLCAPLFWSGLSLLALSYFTFFPIYYIVSGGILLILSAVALIFN